MALLPERLRTGIVLLAGFCGIALLISDKGGPPSPVFNTLGNKVLGVVASPPLWAATPEADNRSDLVTFRLRNEGSENVIIERVTTSCGCTVAELMENPELKPGQESLLRLHAAPPKIGGNIVTVGVQLIAEKKRATLPLQLNLRGKIVSPNRLLSIPSDLETRRTEAGEVTREFDIITAEEPTSTPWLKDLLSNDPSVTAEIISVTAIDSAKTGHQRSYRYKVSGRIPEAEGVIHTANLRLGCHRGEVPPAMFRVLFQRCAMWIASPSSIIFRIGADTPLKRLIAIRANDPENSAELSELSIRPLSPPIQAHWEPSVDDEGRRISIEIDPSNITKPGQQSVVVVNSMQHPVLSIPVNYEIAP